MQSLTFDKTADRPLTILCLGAHSDDIEIGCGGTMLWLLNTLKHMTVHWVVCCSNDVRHKEASASAERFLHHAEHKNIVIRDFRDGFLPYDGKDVKLFFEQLKTTVSPDMIFTHYRHDLHQDHRLVNELTWNTFRNHLIFEYEIPKYDGDIGIPNSFVHLDAALCEEKSTILIETFASQRDKAWFSKDTFFSLLRLRGLESNSPTKYAEGFYCRKIILS
jgi:LmbE family N-acetylglucosaminyl deacetylase